MTNSNTSDKKTMCRLVAANPKEHLDILWRWRNSSDWIRYCTKHKYTVSLEDFGNEIIQAFQDDRFLQFVIYVGGEAVGTTYAYRNNGLTLITTFVEERWKNKGCGVKATVLIAEYLFREFELDSVAFDVNELNVRVLRAIEHLGIKLETKRITYTESGVPYIVCRMVVRHEDYIRISKHLKPHS